MFLALMVLAVPAPAKDLALVIGNRNYLNASWMYDAEAALNSADALRRSGYRVIAGRDFRKIQTRSAIEQFFAAQNNAERIVVVLSGHFVHSDQDTWLLPVDSPAATLAGVNFDGVSLNLLLDVLASKPGESAVFLGTTVRQISTGPALSGGIGALNIPQGVFVATGKPKDIDVALRREFLREGTGFATALKQSPDSVQGFGYVSDLSSLVPGSPDSISAAEAALVEAGYWQATLDAGTKAALQSYLSRYPTGAFAQDARNRIAALDAKTPEDRAREAEAALSLSRDQRREIQRNLTLLEFNTHGIDGIFGRGTRTAIAAWQSQNFFDATGYLRRPQINRLHNQAARRAQKLADEARDLQAKQDAADRAFWLSSGAQEFVEAGLRRYLRRYPDGIFAATAHNRLKIIEEEARRAATQAERTAWDTAAAGGKIADYKGYLKTYPNGRFADEARLRIETLRGDKATEAQIAAARNEENFFVGNVAAKTLVERQLKKIDLKPGPVDGVFDDKTRRAIRRFQRPRKIPVTGYVGQETFVRLVAEADR